MNEPTATKIQREYYSKTASNYDLMHLADHVDPEHRRALILMNAICGPLGINTLLDVGAGTGRGVRFFLDKGKDVKGIEPVADLIRAGESRGIPKGLIIEGDGSKIPYPDNSFDATFECGVLHHVANPSLIVSEMLRVSRKAVFISDNNRFGQGGLSARLVKFGLHKARLWGLARYIMTRGKTFTYSEGDGIHYSYSIFDSLTQISQVCPYVHLLPTNPATGMKRSWSHPILTTSHLLLCGVKQDW